MPENQESLASQFLQSILKNAEKIPHDPKFPYLAAFAEKMKAQYAENPNLTLSQVIEGLNKDIKNNSRKRLFSGWFATSSSVSTGATGAALNIAEAATRAASVALPVVSVIPAAVNLVYGAMNVGWQLNRDLEGRGYLLKYLENAAILMIGDLYEKRKDLKEKIEQEQDEDEKEKLQGQVKELEETIKFSLDELWKFNEIHYKKEPFYCKWAAMSFKGIGSLTGAARLGLSIAATTTAFFSGVGAAVLAGSLLVSDLVFTGLYRKSHRLRNEGAEKCAKNLDKVLEGAIGYYQKQKEAESIADLNEQKLVSPIKARENLKAALMEFKPEEYAKFLYRNHPEKLEPSHIDLLDPKQQKALEKKRKHDEKHAPKKKIKHAHASSSHGHGDEHQTHHADNHHDEHGNEHHHKHKHHHHHHNILDRYFGEDCSHHLQEETSKDEVTFQDLSQVDCSKESDGKKSSILPLKTHVHVPSLNIAPVNALMKLLERATGAVARFMGGRKYKSVAAESPRALATEDLNSVTAIAVNGDNEEQGPKILSTYDSEVAAGEENNLNLDKHSLHSQELGSEAEFGFPTEVQPPATPNGIVFSPSADRSLSGRNCLPPGVVAESQL